MSIKQLIKQSNIPASLICAVVKQIGGWQSFKESAQDISNHGIDGGFSGFIYTQDTWTFTKRNREAIAQMASDQASDFGIGIMEMIRGFGCFRHGTKPTDDEIGRALYAGERGDVSNALAWYAGEEVARAYCDAIEQKQVA